ncbi:MAG: SurA N-terminal domain-containing protein [Betaproteobacteria bacterium]|nr:SurA N-terminal domain-containing protein [Betaproteobacteria bacterium]
MFDLIHGNKRLIQIVLAIIILPFLFFGVDSYFRTSEVSVEVATVGGQRISQQEFNRALRDRQEAIQRLTGGRASPELLDSAELRFDVLESLIRKQLLLNRAYRSGMTISDQQLDKVIAELPVFQRDGKFSEQVAEQFMKSQGMKASTFRARLRDDLMLQHMDDAFGETSFAPRTVIDLLARISEQQREVSAFTIAPDKFTAQVKLDTDAAKKYYESNPGEFRVPEQVRVEYVTLTLDSLTSQIAIDPAEVRKYYDEHRGQFETKQERQASHILIAVESAASAEEKQKARARAEELYRQLKQKPDRFGELAKQYSQDPGSAANGGDLGYFGRGTMPKPFEDAAFGMKAGEISAPVETQYGFHIIRLAGIKGGQGRGFEEARSQIESELKRQRAGRKFAEVAEHFNNVAFEQSESLKPAAEIAKTAARQSGWMTREHAADQLLNNPKLLQAVFSEDVLKNRRNSQVVEVAPGVLVTVRLLEHKPSTMQPFDEVREAVVKKLTLQRAAQLAAQDGRERLEKLKQGKDAQVAWGAAQLVGRADAKGFSEVVLKQAFRADTGKLPAYTGLDNPSGGYTLIRVSRVVEPEKVEPERRKQVAEALRQLLGQEEMLAYIASLKQKGGVTIGKELLDKK